MREINVTPYFGEGEPTRAWVIDEKYAVTSDGLYVHIFEYIKEHDGLYKPAEPFNFIAIAVDEFRTVAGLEHYIQELKKVSAWELLTEHYNINEESFFVNRPKEYKVRFEEDEQIPSFSE
ncbi:hypothetical protein [Paenibacillus sp. DYY-L-2]|uniref:hypothetical protein n=1 Tax=Paenibacillus sp. DYY-L-2 TaxID=3447013 RepID=UPI003F4FE060